MSEFLTPNERDELASAYLDSEATADEVVRVEGDPQILALVEQLRGIREQVGTPPPAPAPRIRAGHISAALAAFDQLGSGRQPGEPGIDLTQQPDQVAAAATTTASDSTVISLDDHAAKKSRDSNQRHRSRGVPGWLAAAAGSLAILGGVGLAATQLGGSGDDSAETASVEYSGADAGAGSGSDAAADPAAANMMEESAATTTAEDGSYLAHPEEDLDGGAADDSAADSEAIEAPANEEAEEENRAARTEKGLFMILPDTPALDILQLLGPDGDPIQDSVCGALADPPEGAEAQEVYGSPLSYYPVLLGDQEMELLIYGPETAILVKLADCTPFSQE